MALLTTGTRVYGNTSIDSILVVGNANTYLATSNTTGSLRVTGGISTTGNTYSGNVYITGSGNGVIFVDGTVQTTNAASYSYSTASFAQANSAYAATNALNIIANTLTTSTTTANQVAMLYSSTTYRTSKVLLQITSGTSYQSSELLVTHDGTNTYMTQYADIYTAGSSLGTFDSNISGGYLQLLFTPVNAATTVKLSTTLIPI